MYREQEANHGHVSRPSPVVFSAFLFYALLRHDVSQATDGSWKAARVNYLVRGKCSWTQPVVAACVNNGLVSKVLTYHTHTIFAGNSAQLSTRTFCAMPSIYTPREETTNVQKCSWHIYGTEVAWKKKQIDSQNTMRITKNYFMSINYIKQLRLKYTERYTHHS